MSMSRKVDFSKRIKNKPKTKDKKYKIIFYPSLF